MKLKPLITSVVFITVFTLSYFGVSYSRSTEKVAGEELTISSLTISSAVATCTEISSWNGRVCDDIGRCVEGSSIAYPGCY